MTERATAVNPVAPLVYAGIDEAGYGPRLGPLCVGMAVFRVEGWTPGDAAPDLWKTLAPLVGREPSRGRPGGRSVRIAVDDSKRLKLANSVKTTHPLVHLEAGVLAFLGTLGFRPTTDAELHAALGCVLEGHAWCAGEAQRAPVSMTTERIGVLCNALATRMETKRVRTLDVQCRVVGEAAFNAGVRETGSKAAVSFGRVAELLRRVWDGWGHAQPRVVVDRQGGRQFYAEALRESVAGAEVRAIEETERVSRYEVTEREADSGDAGLKPEEREGLEAWRPGGLDQEGRGKEEETGAQREGVAERALTPSSLSAQGAGAGRAPAGATARARRMIVQFEVEADGAHFPTALASMTAKLVREGVMARFNRYWCGRIEGLAPTAGYGADAGRWLADVKGRISAEERGVLVRRA